MRRVFFYLLVVTLFTSLFAQQATAARNLVTVTVIGKGMSKKEAVADGQRKAVEEAAGTLIYSETKTKDFVLAKDTILSRAAGFVQSCDIVSKSVDEDGVWTLKLRIVVSKKGIVDCWGVITNLLKQMGRPKVMVFIRESIDGKPQDVSTLQTRLESKLLKNGFILVDKSQIKAIDQKNLIAAVAEDKPEKIQAIAKKFGAQIFITGTANASAAGTKRMHGRVFYRYLADANIRIFRSDTAQLLAAQVGTNDERYGGMQQARRGAATASLARQGNYIVPRITRKIVRFWSDVLEGRGEVQLKVSGLSFGQYAKLKKALVKIKGVKDVTAKYNNKNADISIEADCNAETLAERIVEAMEKKIEITDVSQNVIKADYKK
ncbi:MAG: hypothetical protein K8S55_16100 [Phycisphaerae bacterium]|nr:hypothetical protein [Phycisphaerae bacterium]